MSTRIRRILPAHAALATAMKAQFDDNTVTTMLELLKYSPVEIALWLAPDVKEPDTDGSVISFTAWDTEYAAVRSYGKWRITGGKRTPMSWEELVAWGNFPFRATLEVIRIGRSTSVEKEN